MTADPNKKMPRTFQCREALWQKFEQMARELECSVDYLINDAMKQYARQRGYAGSPSGASLSPPAAKPAMGKTLPVPAPAPAKQAPAPAPPAARKPGVPSLKPPAGPPPAPVRPSLPAPAPPPPVRSAQPAGITPLPPLRAPAPQPATTPPPVAPPPVAPPPMSPPPMAPPPMAPPPAAPHAPRVTPSGLAAVPPLPPPMPAAGRSGPPPMPRQGPPPVAPQPQPGRSPLSSLAIYYGGERFPISKDRFIIGRGKQSSDLTIKDPNVSRQHAMVEFLSGQYYIVDMGSTNGVEFNGQRIQRKAINEGDVFKVCDHELRFSFH